MVVLGACAVVGAGLVGVMGGCADFELGGAQATGGLLQIVGPPTFQEMVTLADDAYSADNRQRGVLQLANSAEGAIPGVIEIYRERLGDEDSLVRTVAVRALGIHGSAADAQRLGAMIDDESPMVRWEVARALQRLHDPQVVPGLLRHADATRESEIEVRVAAVTALGQYAQRPVLDALVIALDDRDLAVVDAASASLFDLTGQDFGYDYDQWAQWVAAASAGGGDPFADRRTYRFPAYERDAKWFEWINPFFEVPSEAAGSPAGLPPMERPKPGSRG